MHQPYKLLTLLVLLFFISSCQTDATEQKTDDTTEVVGTTPPVEKKNVRIPAVNADSAYWFVHSQLEFGPRVPNSSGHQKCKEWIVAKLKSYGVEVIEQNFNVEDYTGKELNATNIIGRINPEMSHRVLLAAHWDTRFMADQDMGRIEDPIMGADDGASGVAGLLEIARTIQENPIEMGVDLVFFDVEDQGESQGLLETWCMGSQYWANNPHVPGYTASFGILLDMIGAKGALFQKENVEGVHDAAKVQKIHRLYNRVWSLAASMKKDKYFMNRFSTAVTDDHYFVNKLTDITMIDIINRPIQSETGFAPYWHTHNDAFPIIDKNTLGAVLQVVAAVIYKESGNNLM